MLGSKTLRARNIVKNGVDHHHLRQVLEMGLSTFHIKQRTSIALCQKMWRRSKFTRVSIMDRRKCFRPELHVVKDMCTQYPGELIEYFEATESFSPSGIPNRCQGADFIHEEVPKNLVKSFFPPGMPDETVWTWVCCKITKFRAIINQALEKSDIRKYSTKRRLKFELKEAMVRKEMMYNQYITPTSKLHAVRKKVRPRSL